VTDACSSCHLGEAPVEQVRRVAGSALVAEDEVVFLPRFAALSVLSRLVCFNK
jgi:hypothetical protein